MPRRALVIAISLIAVGQTTGADDARFVEIVDGDRLTGWRVTPAERKGDWSARDGVIVGVSQGKGSDLIWKGGDVGDFELKLRYRFRTPGNSGIHVRGRLGESRSHRVKGYHADFGHAGIGPGVLGAWDFHGAPRGSQLVERGQRVHIDDRGAKRFTKLENALTAKDIRKGAWNDVHVIARGNRLYFTINGKMASEVIDDEVAKLIDRGVIGLQLHGGAPMTVEFRDIRLKRLPSKGDPSPGIGLRKQLLVDDHVIAERKNVMRQLERPVKANDGRPVLLGDQPWEEFATPILGNVTYFDGKFRCWYRGGGSGPEQGIWCYAESTDGMRWTKPKLGLVEFRGDKENNIFVRGQPQAFTPFVDPNETDPSQRFKSAINTIRIDTALGYSSDGVRWSLYRDGKPITGRASDTISQVVWDRWAKVYRLYTRTDYGSGGGAGEVRGTRDMVAAADADLADPASWRTIREWCLGWERGNRDYGRQRQIYSLNGWVHEGVQFALLWTLETGGNEVMDYYLATTRGERPWNLHWVYANRPFVERGAEGAFDCRWIQPATNIVTHDDRHWIYYVGLAKTHRGESSPHIDGPAGGIGLATLPLDRFVSLTAGEEPGVVVTKPFELAGAGLEVNVDASRGEVRVEVLDSTGQPLAGYAGDDAITLRNVDQLRLSPRWKRPLGDLKGKTIRLRFHLRRAALYAFRVTE